MAQVSYDDDKNKPDTRRSSKASTVSSTSVVSDASKASWTSLSNLSLYKEGKESGIARTTSSASSVISTAESSSSSWSSVMRTYRACPPITIPNDRVANMYLRRISADEQNHYRMHSTNDGSHTYIEGNLASGQGIFPNTGCWTYSMSKILPKPAALFMIDFDISRSTGSLTRSIRLSDCDGSGNALLNVLKAGQLTLSSRKRVKLPKAFAIRDINFTYGIREPYASHASLSLASDAIDPAQTIKKAYITCFYWYRNGDLQSTSIKGRRCGATNLTAINIPRGSINDQAIPANIDQLDEKAREHWLGPMKRLGSSRVHQDWIMTDLTFRYDGTPVGGLLKRIRGPTKLTLPPPPPPDAYVQEEVYDHKETKTKKSRGFSALKDRKSVWR